VIPNYAVDVLRKVEAGGGSPPPGFEGGRPFANREGKLPQGAYREYDVHPLSAGSARGPERLIIERETRRAYYTADHYGTFEG